MCSNSDELVDGSTLLKLTVKDLKDMQMKAGPLQKVLELIQNACTVDCNVLKNGEVIPSCSSDDINGDIKQVLKLVVDNGTIAKEASQTQSSQILHADLFNVRQWVKKYDEDNICSTSLEKILDSGAVSDVKRQALVRIVVSHLTELSGNAYPSVEFKKLAAESIVHCFPKLKNSTHTGGYEHYYDSKTGSGFIEFRLKTVRKHLPINEKKRGSYATQKIKKKLKIENQLMVTKLDKETLEAKIAELSFKMPNETNKAYILLLMDETRYNRQQWIKDVKNDCPPSLTDILIKYPRFKDFNGELILREFQHVFTDKDSFLGKFPSYYSPRIITYCKRMKPQLLAEVNDILDINLKALMLLPFLLPSPNYMKNKKTNNPNMIKGSAKSRILESTNFAIKKIPNQNLLRFLKTNDDLLQATQSKENKTHVQPFLICATTDHERRGMYYIKADNFKIPVGDNIIVAFDILVKMHYVFDLSFAPDLEIFYNFISACTMGLDIPAKSCCSAFDATLLHMEASEDFDEEISHSDEE